MTTARETDHAPGEHAEIAEETTPLSVDQLRAVAAQAAESSVSRRKLMRTAAIAGTVAAAGVGLAACGSGGSSSYGASGSSGSTGGATQPASNTGAAGGGSAPSSAASSGGSGATGTEIASTSQIPVGGGVVFADQKVVVTQPTAGTFKAFSSTCTHAGCTVNKVAAGLIDCPCHGSKFSAETGAVKAGPAPSPLPAQNITEQGGKLYLNT